MMRREEAGAASVLGTGRDLVVLAAFWLALLPLFICWLYTDRLYAPWDLAMHSRFVLRLHDGLLGGEPWRVYQLSRLYPPLFHVLALPASFISTNPDAFCFGNWLALLGLLWGTFLLGRALAGESAGLAAAFVTPMYSYVAWMGRMPITDLALTATVTWTLFLLSRSLRLADGYQARWLGIAIGLGMLAKPTYAFYTFLPFSLLFWTHCGSLDGEPRSRPFWSPLATLAAWPLVLAGPWYVRSVPGLVRQARWHLGTGVQIAEGDAPPFSLAGAHQYAAWLGHDYMTAPTLALLACGILVLLHAWHRKDRAEIAPPARWIPLGLTLVGGSLCLIGVAGKDSRYLMPMVPSLAVVSGAVMVPLPLRWRRAALIACAFFSFGMVTDNLFRRFPPDPTDWKVTETAQEIVARLPARGRRFKVLVVPNDERMNFLSLTYAIQCVRRVNVEVERIEAPLDDTKLAEFRRVVLTLPPPHETVVSRHSTDAAHFILSRSDWTPEAKLTRGDGREIWIMAPNTPQRIKSLG